MKQRISIVIAGMLLILSTSSNADQVREILNNFQNDMMQAAPGDAHPQSVREILYPMPSSPNQAETVRNVINQFQADMMQSGIAPSNMRQPISTFDAIWNAQVGTMNMDRRMTQYVQPDPMYAPGYAAPVYYYAPVEYTAPAYYAPMPNYQAQYAAYQHAQQAQWAAIQQQEAAASAAQFAVETQPADTPPVKPVKKRALSVSVVGRSAGQLAALIVAPSVQQSPPALSATQASSAPAAVNESSADAAAKAAHERRLAMLTAQTEQARQEVVRWLGYSIAFSSVAIGVSVYVIAHAAKGNSTP